MNVLWKFLINVEPEHDRIESNYLPNRTEPEPNLNPTRIETEFNSHSTVEIMNFRHDQNFNLILSRTKH